MGERNVLQHPLSSPQRQVAGANHKQRPHRTMSQQSARHVRSRKSEIHHHWPMI
jgi:hypothetical protein